MSITAASNVASTTVDPGAPRTAIDPARRPALARAMDNPTISWPAVGLALGCVAAWIGLITAAELGAMPLPLAVALLSITGYVAFTPMHDGTHKSVSRTPWINDGVGRLCGLLLLAPYTAFRFAHLQHHRHTNTDEKDPDLWSGRGPRWALPLRWLTQDLHYYAYYLRRRAERPRAEQVETFGTIAVLLTVIATGTAMGLGTELLLYWILPARVAIGILAFAFDYLPHVPHDVPSSEDRFRATSNLRLGARVPMPVLSPVLLYQNYHLVHHLYPGVPFYRYSRVWRLREEELRSRGAQVRAIL